MEQNLSQYRIFYAVAKAGNISRAAKELYIIQPRAFKLKDGTYRDEIIMVKMLRPEKDKIKSPADGVRCRQWEIFIVLR